MINQVYSRKLFAQGLDYRRLIIHLEMSTILTMQGSFSNLLTDMCLFLKH